MKHCGPCLILLAVTLQVTSCSNSPASSEDSDVAEPRVSASNIDNERIDAGSVNRVLSDDILDERGSVGEQDTNLVDVEIAEDFPVDGQSADVSNMDGVGYQDIFITDSEISESDVSVGSNSDTSWEPEGSPWEDVVFPGPCPGDPDCTDTVFIDVSAGMFHTCAVMSSGEIMCWGKNQEGQATPPAGSFERVWCGWEQTCALTTDKNVVCWGLDSQGQSSPPEDILFSELSIGRSHVCAVDVEQKMRCWGENHQGMTDVPPGKFMDVAVGRYFSCGLRTDGVPVCFGDDSQGTVAGIPSGPFERITAGRWHVCGLTTDGTVDCWGSNEFNQLSVPAGPFTRIDGGWTHTCALRTDETVICWGEDHQGMTLPPSNSDPWTWVSAGDGHNCGLQQGRVICWGDDLAAQSFQPGDGGPDQQACEGLDCSDGDSCTVDSCLSGTCYFHQIQCDDGDPCTGEMGKDYCDPETGLCQFPLWWDCDDGNPCTYDLCDGVGGCSHTAHSEFCDDDDPCTQEDQCVDGVCEGAYINQCLEECVGEPVPECIDDDVCTDDYCDPAVGCLHEVIPNCK